MFEPDEVPVNPLQQQKSQPFLLMLKMYFLNIYISSAPQKTEKKEKQFMS